MSWLQTYTGLSFDPINPDVNTINVMDIAHSLSLQCRFNGHCLFFYSVAEHSVRVSKVLRKKRDRLWGLLHDASEAYVSDVIRPVKEHLPEYVKIEEKVQEAIAKRFNLPWPMPEAVKHADDILLMTERRDILLPTIDPWKLDDVEPLADIIRPWTPQEAMLSFLHTFNELTAGISTGIPVDHPDS